MSFPAQNSASISDATYASDHALEGEDLVLDAWRFEQFRALGLTGYDAVLLVVLGVSWHDAERLITRGCPPNLIVPILQ